MERDEEARTAEAPAELARELRKSKTAQQRWETLAFTHKKEMANSIRDAKREQTRQRRLVLDEQPGQCRCPHICESPSRKPITPVIAAHYF